MVVGYSVPQVGHSATCLISIIYLEIYRASITLTPVFSERLFWSNYYFCAEQPRRAHWRGLVPFCMAVVSLTKGVLGRALLFSDLGSKFSLHF